MPTEDGKTLREDWPEAPWYADYHEPSFFGWQGYGFTVAHAPPPPWPLADEYAPGPEYGPPGTVWLFTLADVVDAYTAPGASFVGKAVLRRALRKLGSYSVGGDIFAWRTPDTPESRADVTIRVLRTVIHAKIGSLEEVAHVMHWRDDGETGPNLDIPAVKAFGDTVRTTWATMWGSRVGASTFQITDVTPASLVYDEVRTSYLEIAPGVKPTYLVPTQYSPFAANTVKGLSAKPAMPYEVAMAVGLNTNLRGPRNRGRLYLGPFTSDVMGGDGIFDPTLSKSVATILGTNFIAAVNSSTAYHAVVLSTKYATSSQIQGTRSGSIPDSQRRRRRSLPEAYQQAWGTAIGAA